MLQKALQYFRSRLYHLRQQKELNSEKASELEKSQLILKTLNKTLQDESLRKIQDLKLERAESTDQSEERHGYNRQPIGRKNSISKENTHA